MTRRAISTTGAPAAIGPYSQGIVIDGLLFCSGQAALDPATGVLVDGGIEPETERVMANLDRRPRCRRAAWADVVKTTIFLVDMADFATVNAIYGRFVGDPPPARSTVGVAALPRGRGSRSRWSRRMSDARRGFRRSIAPRVRSHAAIERRSS